jgi:hypothetical protein
MLLDGGELMAEKLKTCISDPIPQIFDAARYLDAAVTAHLQGKYVLAAELICAADMPDIYKWLKPIWANSKANIVSPTIQNQPVLSRNLRAVVRMPNYEEKQGIHQRDGYNCRFCGIPVIRPEVRSRIVSAYSAAARWGRKELDQHSAFQAMWAQYDHIVPHSKGGTNDLDNMVLACAACNFGRSSYSLEEVGVTDPRVRSPLHSDWDGLERFK